jgi:hypothetical protein
MLGCWLKDLFVEKTTPPFWRAPSGPQGSGGGFERFMFNFALKIKNK